MKFFGYQIISPFKKDVVDENCPLPLTSGFEVDVTKVKPGRESEEPSDVFATSSKFSPIEPGFSLEWLPILENLAAYNQDVGYAVDNIVQLSNTPYEIEFADGVAEKLRKDVMKLINDNKDNWYSFSGGFHSFRSDALAMAAINGAISVEIVPNRSLDNISLVRVPPKYIRFMYNKQTEQYEPFQQVRNAKNADANYYGLKKLNTIKYKYIAWRRLLEGPYPVPPFLTAIRTIDIQNDIISNLAFVIEKLGMLGFLTASVEPPKKNPNENDEAYFNRCLKYLETKVYPQLQKNLSKGLVVGFKGSHEFNIAANNMNVTGAQNLVKIVEQMLFAGLKQDPNMLGRNFSTTETFGRVIMAKMTNQVKDYQNMLNSLSKDIFKMFIALKGYDPNIISGVSCDPAMIRDKGAEETARSTEIDNAFKLRDGGIIDQQATANELGYEEAADPEYKKAEPVPQGDNNNNNNENDPENDDEENMDENETQENIRRISKRLYKKTPEFLYETNHCHGTSMTLLKSSNFNDKTMNNFVNSYAGQVYEQYSKFNVSAVNAAVNAIQKLNSASPIQTIQEQVYLAILGVWEDKFSDRIDAICEKNCEKIYTHYRKDRSIFPGEEGFAKTKVGFEEIEIPDAIFGLDDFRAIEYAAESDTMYLGKFITDESTKKKVYKYLEDSYINGDLPFGNNSDQIKEFKNQFSELFDFESYKIRRVIDTSVNNLRNDANIRYIGQAELTEYEVIEIGDNRTCEYCNFMNGMVFKVDNALSKINNKIELTPDKIGTVSPFVTTMKIDEFTKLNPEQLQLAGFSTPSYHASCRGRIVAKI